METKPPLPTADQYPVSLISNELLSTAQVAKYLGVSARTVRRLIRREILQSRTIVPSGDCASRRATYRVDFDDLMLYISRCMFRPSAVNAAAPQS
ncbi:helix-turn-helix domain-containing protein [Deinococcus psychrotolerans]|uniref:helix-turn-helix domain-containing protein n=1 Tax=Deinococcus psychrotolerans TaxID=2489213 RepID=UPI0013DDDDC9|nr:helix-turn-helix domain-containing protein [Deinococcus psychrotolerans]